MSSTLIPTLIKPGSNHHHHYHYHHQQKGWPDSESCDVTDLTHSRIIDMNDVNIMNDLDANVRNVIDRIYR